MRIDLKKLQIVLIILLIVCVLPMPYGYFTVVRLSVCLYFGYLAYIQSRKSKTSRQLLFLYIAIVLAFQPFIRLPFGRLIWNIIDVSLAIWLLLNLGKKR